MLAGKIKYNKQFQHLGHECEMLAEEDDIEKFYPGTSLWVKIRRKWMRSTVVNESICKRCSTHLRSHGAINKERKRQLMYFRRSIHPYSEMRVWWDFIMLFIWLAILFLVPLDLALYHFDLFTAPFITSKPFIWIRMILDLFCCVDLIFNSLTGYYDEYKKQVILNHNQIVIHYLKHNFFIDLMAALPTHVDCVVDLEMNREAHTAGIILHILSILKFSRFFTFERNFKRICSVYLIDFYVRQLILLVFTVVIFWHMISFSLVYVYVMIESRDVHVFYENTTLFKAWSRAIYDGSLVFYTSSYGVTAATRKYEFLTKIFFWILSKFVQIYLLARIIELLRARTSPVIKYSKILKQITEFMRHKKLPLYTQKRILTYYEYHYQKSYFRESEIYNTISGQVRQEIIMQSCRRLVENVEFFKDLPFNLLIRIVTCMQSEIYLSNDVVVRANAPGNSMYFIAAGTVAVYTVSGKEVCHLEDGAYFGEIALVTSNSKRVATVIAVETCELYRLDRRDFVKAIQPYPDLLERIQKIAADRTEKTSTLDEHNRKRLF